MDINQFISDVNSINWHSYCREDYQPERVPISLIALARADQESKEGIYQRAGTEVDLLLNAKIKSDVMFAVGNDHRGTYYPVARRALPFVIQIALYGFHVVARNCAINILIDLFYFCSDCDSDDMLNKFVKDEIKSTIIANRENFKKFAADDKRNGSLIESLMGIADDSH